MEIEKNLPIGFMDSGLGGLSVLKEALRVMPYEDFEGGGLSHQILGDSSERFGGTECGESS